LYVVSQDVNKNIEWNPYKRILFMRRGGEMAENIAVHRVYYRETTASQRKLLFQVWEETQNVSEACRRAKVGRNTFYYWKPRYDAHGSAGIEVTLSHAPHHPRKTPSAVVERVLAMKRAQPAWGKRRIAQELRKENGWVWVVSASTVRGILQEHGLLSSAVQQAEKRETQASPSVRHAERPGQTVNVDLCFVPAAHGEPETIPAVSGSSGRLTVSPAKSAGVERTWPGHVFANSELSYEEAMDTYIATRTQASSESPSAPTPPVTEQEAIKAQKREVKRQEEHLRIERRQEREQRKVEDATWQTMKAQRHAEQAQYQSLSRQERTQKRAEHGAAEERWRAQKQKRRTQKRRRQEEDKAWRAQRQKIREHKEEWKSLVAWFAILVIVDNCTRQVLGLPLFVTGPHVTAAEVVDALRLTLPPDLQYLIADRGKHFVANVMKKLEHERGFVRVPLAPHRPQSNGIAERFVRTLKEWLSIKTWLTAEELRAWLKQFFENYNDRPHQGRELKGLSPNEYARRKREEKICLTSS
jgi:transposase InsO family protein